MGCRIVALGKPSDIEKTQWYFQRYVAHLPSAGEIVLFDRSWYNRAGVEHVMGFCTQEEYTEFLRSCPEFERMLIHSGIILLKYWFSVSDEEQERRFHDRAGNPARRWKLSEMDIQGREKWVEFSKAKDEMFRHTDTKQSPWYTVEADDKRRARLNCIAHLLSMSSLRGRHATVAEIAATQTPGRVLCPSADGGAEHRPGREIVTDSLPKKNKVVAIRSDPSSRKCQSENNG